MLGLQQCLRPPGGHQKQLHAEPSCSESVAQQSDTTGAKARAGQEPLRAALLLCVQGLQALPQSLLNQICNSPKEEKSENLLDILISNFSAT